MYKWQTDGALYIYLALGILLLPFSWLLAAILAAAFHELCHYAAAKWRKSPPWGLSLAPGGMVMHLGETKNADMLLIAAAGPAGSLLLGCLVHVWPQLAVCGIVQGGYNLLPIYPLDGGRIFRCLLGDRVKWLESGCIILIVLSGAMASFRYDFGFWPLFLAITVCCKAILRKFPCKAEKLGVQ